MFGDIAETTREGERGEETWGWSDKYLKHKISKRLSGN
jgi:hypothetical protein